MKVCESCHRTFLADAARCSSCGQPTVAPKQDDEYLKKFLEVDAKTLRRFQEVREQTIQEAAQRGKRVGPLTAIGVSGSARDKFDMAAEESNSEFLLKEALDELAKAGVKTELLSLRKYNIQPCKACYSTANNHCHFYCSCYERGDSSRWWYEQYLVW